jgi:ethanolamine utilization protein EutJ
MNPHLDEWMQATEAAMTGAPSEPVTGRIRVGVDLGTAYTVVLALDESGWPLVGAYRFAQVVRDGLVVDFHGAIRLVSELKAEVEARLGRRLERAASGYPPGVPRAEVRATAHVLHAAGLECDTLTDEPTAANRVLQIRDGAIVDVGGGTTGVAVVRAGEVVYTADEATGGTHFTLVVAGHLGIPFGEAETLKTNPDRQRELFPVIRPVMEKVGTIVARHIAPYHVSSVYLVGGTVAFPGFAEVVQAVVGVPTSVPTAPLFVTPLGIALAD